MDELYIFTLKYKDTDFYNSFIVYLGHVEGTIFQMCYKEGRTLNEIAEYIKFEYTEPRVDVSDVKNILTKIATKWKKFLMYYILYKNITIKIDK